MLAKPLTFNSNFLHPFKTIRRKVASTFQHTTTSAIAVSMTTGWCRAQKQQQKKPLPVSLVLEPFININETTGTGCKIIQIKSSLLLLGTTGSASWMQVKKEHNKHQNVVLIKGGAIFLS